MAEIDKVFKAGIKFNASDIHVVPGEPFIMRRLGQLIQVKGEKLTNEYCQKLILEIITDEQRERLQRDLQLDFVYKIPGLGRFRGNAVMHRNGMSATFRIIPPEIPHFEQLNLPDTVKRLLDNHQGLILVTGAAGQGKSTTLAAMVNHINMTRSHHILTIEDPIEFVHPLNKSIINQRQIDRDTLSYANALRAALREDPDVIVIGELRDLETMSLAISASETGHLVLGTLSSTSTSKTVERIIDSFPPGEQNQIRAMLGESLKAIITQCLIPGADRTRMELALEILIGTIPVTNLIRDNKVFQIPSIMQTGKKAGMQIMDDSIMTLLYEGRISIEHAKQYANDKRLFERYVEGKQYLNDKREVV